MRGRAWPLWAATGALLLANAGMIALFEFACAVGEYEEDNPTCETPVFAIAGIAAVAAGVVAGGLSARRSLHWLGLAAGRDGLGPRRLTAPLGRFDGLDRPGRLARVVDVA